MQLDALFLCLLFPRAGQPCMVTSNYVGWWIPRRQEFYLWFAHPTITCWVYTVTGTDAGLKLINLSFASRGSHPTTLAAWCVTEDSAYPIYKILSPTPGSVANQKSLNATSPKSLMANDMEFLVHIWCWLRWTDMVYKGGEGAFSWKLNYSSILSHSDL